MGALRPAASVGATPALKCLHELFPAAFQRVWVQNASVVVADLLATNGVLHVLSQVWLEGGVRTGKFLVRPRGGDVLSSPVLRARSYCLHEGLCRRGRDCCSSWTPCLPSTSSGSCCR